MNIKKIWIFSHNSTPPSVGQWVRHYMFSKYGDKSEFKTTIFTSSNIHLSDKNFMEHNEKFISRNFEGVEYCFIGLKKYNRSKVQRVVNMFLFIWRLILSAEKYVEEVPDIIFASSPDPLTWFAAYRLGKRYNIPYILETRDLWPETFVELGVLRRNGFIAKLLYRYERFMYSKADKLVFTFEGGNDYLLERNIKRDRKDVVSINNGVDYSVFKENIITYPFYDEDLDNPDIKTIVYTGSLGKANNLYTLLHFALNLKRLKHNDIKILLFGEGLEKEGLLQFIKEHHLSNVVFKGKVEKKYIPSILCKSDINVIVGYHNNLYRFGYSFNKLFDYMAAGKPIVSTVKSNYDLIERFQIGKTVDINDDISFYKTVITCLHDRDLQETIKKNALVAVQNYRYEKLSKDFYELVTMTLGEKK